MTHLACTLSAKARAGRLLARAVLVTSAIACLGTLPLADASPPKHAKGPLVGGKAYNGTVVGRGAFYTKNYDFYVPPARSRRRNNHEAAETALAITRKRTG